MKRNWGGPKVSLHAYASRNSPPSHTLLDQKLDPRVYLGSSILKIGSYGGSPTDFGPWIPGYYLTLVENQHFQLRCKVPFCSFCFSRLKIWEKNFSKNFAKESRTKTSTTLGLCDHKLSKNFGYIFFRIKMATFYLGMATFFLGLATFFLGIYFL